MMEVKKGQRFVTHTGQEHKVLKVDSSTVLTEWKSPQPCCHKQIKYKAWWSKERFGFNGRDFYPIGDKS